MPASDGGSESTLGVKDRIREASGDSIFRNKKLLDPQHVVDEDRIVGRDKQLDEIIKLLQPAINDHRPPNMLLYGPSGTGKSLIINLVSQHLVELAEIEGTDIGVITLNCQLPNSHDQAVYRLVKHAAETAGVSVDVPKKGVSTSDKLDRLYEILDTNFDSTIVILDEIDLLEGRGQEPAHSKLLYQLSRAHGIANVENVSVVGLTNKPKFTGEELDGRTESSFNPKSILFSDYEADQLQQILNRRRDAYKDDAVDDGIIKYIAALAARDHGDARKAIDLFKVAGKIADRHGCDTISEDNVRTGQKEAEVDRTLNQIRGLSQQKMLSLYATAAVSAHAESDGCTVPNTVAYTVYQYLTEQHNYEQKTEESFRRYMNEAETYGFVTSARRGRGRGNGMMKIFEFSKDPEIILETLEGDDRLKQMSDDQGIERVVRAQLHEHTD